jgi:hypothetical protein
MHRHREAKYYSDSAVYAVSDLVNLFFAKNQLPAQE